MNARCRICHVGIATNQWQPFGPAEDARLVCAPGWHYRGYNTIAICDACADKITKTHTPFEFDLSYKKQRFHISFDGKMAKAVAA